MNFPKEFSNIPAFFKDTPLFMLVIKHNNVSIYSYCNIAERI
jgi:hypothetical protein